MLAKPPPKKEINPPQPPPKPPQPPPKPPEPHRTPIQNEPKQTKTQAVQQRLDLAAKAAARTPEGYGNAYQGLAKTQAAQAQAAQAAQEARLTAQAKALAAQARIQAQTQRTTTGVSKGTNKIPTVFTNKPGSRVVGRGDPAPQFPGVPDKGTGNNPGGGNPPDYGDPEPGPTIYTEFRGASSSPSSSAPPSPVLIPGRDALNFATSGVIDSLTSFIFEDLAGTEIITLMKRDTIDGIDPNYSIISNISDARRTFDPTSLLSKKSKTDSYFDIFGIQLLDKIPDDEYLAKKSIVNYYYIASNGDLVIELDNLSADERVEIEIATNGTINELDNS